MKRRLAFNHVSLRKLIVLLIVVATGLTVPVPAVAGKQLAKIDAQLVESSGPSVRAILVGGDREQNLAATNANGGRVIRTLGIGDALSVELPQAAITPLSQVPGLERIAYDAPMVVQRTRVDSPFAPNRLATQYPWALAAPQLWQRHPAIAGGGIGVAVIDSGIASVPDFSGTNGSRVVANVVFSTSGNDTSDTVGHGTAVAGVIAGNGNLSQGEFVGIAPQVNLINIKVGDEQGTYVSDVIAALKWAVDHKAEYNIRVINLSLSSSSAESYKTSLLDLAVEYAWFNGIVVVVASGNTGPGGVVFPPANDPYVITVGATDDIGSKSTADDALAAFSGYGNTQDNHPKPDLAAPGRHLVTTLASADCQLAQLVDPDRIIDGKYIMLSGTSFAAAAVSGLAALVSEAKPTTKPDQFKWLVSKTASLQGASGEGAAGLGAGYPDATRAAAYGGPLQLANRGLVPNMYLAQAVAEAYFQGISWEDIDWDGVSWDNIDWGGVSWDGVSWDTFIWGGVSWDGVSWDTMLQD